MESGRLFQGGIHASRALLWVSALVQKGSWIMYKTAILASAAFVAAALAPVTPAFAAADPAATVTKDGACSGFVPDADGNPAFVLFTPDGGHGVQTNGETQAIICQFDIPDGQEPAKATHAEGFLCVTYGTGFTNDTKMVATPGGRATLVCNINGPKP